MLTIPTFSISGEDDQSPHVSGRPVRFGVKEHGMVTCLESRAFVFVALKQPVGITLSLGQNIMSGFRAFLPRNGQSTSFTQST
jgi:hypothetical protein